jgi:hypothetical protein
MGIFNCCIQYFQIDIVFRLTFNPVLSGVHGNKLLLIRKYLIVTREVPGGKQILIINIKAQKSLLLKEP